MVKSKSESDEVSEESLPTYVSELPLLEESDEESSSFEYEISPFDAVSVFLICFKYIKIPRMIRMDTVKVVPATISRLLFIIVSLILLNIFLIIEILFLSIV